MDDYVKLIMQSRVLWMWMAMALKREDREFAKQQYLIAWWGCCEDINNYSDMKSKVRLLRSIKPDFPWVESNVESKDASC